MAGSTETPSIPAPKVVRMPVENDRNASKQAARYRSQRYASKGRRSTIMSESLKEMTGSSGRTLGGGY
jgi:hypothetical protein